MNNPKLKNQLFGGILGLAVADAVGVPVEFQSRESLRRNPVTDMRGHGTYNQPPGTWSDDTSLTLCLLDSLAHKKFDWRAKDALQPDFTDIVQRFLSWKNKGEYTAHGKVFDIGIATRQALQRFENGTKPLECGGTSEQDNGNGSLMRILPLAFYYLFIDRRIAGEKFNDHKFEELIKCIHNVSSLTHAHKRSQIACGLYLFIAIDLLERPDLHVAIECGLEIAQGYYEDRKGFVDGEWGYIYEEELKHYKRIFKANFARLPEEKIKSSGYVVDTLEAALWCLLNTSNYKDCVLKAVNLGEDTDTVAAVAGGLAGMYYGVDAIPKDWLNQLARRDYIEKLCDDFYRWLLDSIE